MLWRCTAFLAIACAGCGCGADAGLRVESGTYGYVRCLEAPVSAREWRVGPMRLTIDESRVLRIDSDARPLRLAVGTGAEAVEARMLRTARPSLILVLGDLGVDNQHAATNLARLGDARVPVLFVAGGTDTFSVLDELEDERGLFVDASRLRKVRIGNVELVPLAGAPSGRYAVSNDACGFARGDVDRIASAVGRPDRGVARYVVSWAAPNGVPGLAGIDAGSPLVSRLIQRVGARGVVFGWPRAASIERGERLLVGAPPLGGPAFVRADGTRRQPGATVLTLDENDLSAPSPAP